MRQAVTQSRDLIGRAPLPLGSPGGRDTLVQTTANALGTSEKWGSLLFVAVQCGQVLEVLGHLGQQLAQPEVLAVERTSVLLQVV